MVINCGANYKAKGLNLCLKRKHEVTAHLSNELNSIQYIKHSIFQKQLEVLKDMISVFHIRADGGLIETKQVLTKKLNLGIDCGEN